jgi:hypothetical protein
MLGSIATTLNEHIRVSVHFKCRNCPTSRHLWRLLWSIFDLDKKNGCEWTLLGCLVRLFRSKPSGDCEALHAWDLVNTPHTTGIELSNSFESSSATMSTANTDPAPLVMCNHCIGGEHNKRHPHFGYLAPQLLFDAPARQGNDKSAVH